MKPNIFDGTTGPHSAKVVIVGEAWGDQEAAQHLPFVGASGQELDRMLAEAGFNRAEILCCNVINAQPPSGKMENFFGHSKSGLKEKWGLYPTTPILEGLAQLESIIAAHPRTLIIAAGNYALWALTGLTKVSTSDKDTGNARIPTGISSWRGSMVYTRPEFGNTPCLPIIHPVMVFKEYSWRSVIIHDLSARVPKALKNEWAEPPSTRISQPLFEKVTSFLHNELAQLDRGLVLYRVVDIETKRRNIVCTGIATSRSAAITIPHCGVNALSELISWWPFEQEVKIARLLRRYLLHPNIRLIGQNFLYDMQYISRWFRAPTIKCHYDTMLAQHAMFPGTPKSLDYLASLYCEHYIYWKDESQEWDEKVGGVEALLNYCCMDCMKTYEVWEQQQIALDATGMRPQFDFLMESHLLAYEMMQEGFNIDQDARSKMLFEDVIPQVTSRQKWLANIIPQSYMKGYIKENKKSKKWWESTHQQRILFYEVLGLREQRNRKTKRPTFDDEALNKLKELYPSLTRIFETIAEMRSLGVFKNTFLEAPLDPDGRLRCAFSWAETSRYTSSANAFWRGTNMQNIPKGDED